MRGIFLFHCFLVACYVASIIDLYFQFGLYGAFYIAALIIPFYSFTGFLFLSALGRFYSILVNLREVARHIYQLRFNPETVRAGPEPVRAGEPWDSSCCCWYVETLVLCVGHLYFIGIFGFFLYELFIYSLTMTFLAKPTPVWHAIMSYFYIVCFYPWAAVWNASRGFLRVPSQADAELLDELMRRRLEEQEEAILEDETATVATEEDDDDRRQAIDSLKMLLHK
jgi:hypothetical protein